MRGWRVTLTLCVVAASLVLGAAPTQQKTAQAPHHETRPSAARRQRSASAVSTDSWQNLISEYTRGVAGPAGATGSALGSWFPSPIPIQVPLQGESGARSSVPLLVVPIPVPVPVAAPRAAPAQCAASPQPARSFDSYVVPGPAYTNAAAPSPAAYNTVVPYNRAPVYGLPAEPLPPVATPAPSVAPAASPYSVERGPPAPPAPPASPAPTAEPAPPFTARYTPAPAPRNTPRRPASDERLARMAPKFPPVDDSKLLVELFRSQEPTDPGLPPIVIDPVGIVSTDDYTVEELEFASGVQQRAASLPQSAPDAGAELPPTPDADHAKTVNNKDETQSSTERRRLICRRRKMEAGEADVAAPPPPPRFERSLFLRGRLTVMRADYTEPYSLWWDAASGASRVDFHGGTTSTYRMMKRDGRVQSVQIRVDRTGEADVRRCIVTTPRRMSLAERSLPALPDLQGFTFAGYVQRGAERTERWRYTLSGHSGELGGARGEALTFRHELLVSRTADNFTTLPLRYSVRVDSSVLGADCDTYVHYFDEVQMRHHDPAMFKLDIADACEQVELSNQMEIVEPLREFTMLRRDPRHDSVIDQYKKKYDRVYGDDVEEAVRKNVLMQSTRHTESANRQGASFEMETNFLADRLTVERRVLLGVEPTLDADPGEPFPHSRSELAAKRGRLPRSFDWRERGAVTPVRDQMMCASCWAFATVGAVEGALFVETGRLVPLSEQTLVDCAMPYGAHGCKGTWPSFAYNYVKDRGLPALDEYTPYKGEVLQCRADSVPPVTRISGHVNVTKDNIIALKVAIQKYGPTVVIIDGQATTFAGIKKGRAYYHDARCRKNSHNHAVLAVGWTVYRGETYFIIKNSWATAWGDEGYARIRASTNTCGVLRKPTLPRLRAADVQRVPAGAPAAATPPPGRAR